MDEDEITTEEAEDIISTLRSINPQYVTLIIILCLALACYYLGFIWGFNQAFSLQEDYYEEKMLKYCFCQDVPTYNIPNTPLEIPDFSANSSS